MKRYGRILITLAAVLVLAGCGKKADEAAVTGTEESVVSQTQPETEKIRIEPSTEAQATEAAEPETSAAETEAETAAETTAAETKKQLEETQPAKVYQVTAMQKTMYAIQPVHVRKSYTKQSDVITSLGTGQKVEVTGIAANGWIRIAYHGQDAYVYKAYLTEDKNQTAKNSGKDGKTAETKAAESKTSESKTPESVPAGTGTGPVPEGQVNAPILVPSPGGNTGQGYGPDGNAVTGVNGGPGVNIQPGLTDGPGGDVQPDQEVTGIISSAGPGGAS